MGSDQAEKDGKFHRQVLKWIRDNPSEFTTDGKPDDGNRPDNELRYRPRALKRCKQYDDAPDEYLHTMLKTFPDFIKWYFNIFQTVFVATLVGSSVAAFAFTYKNFLDWVSTISSLPTSLGSFLLSTMFTFSSWISWVLPALFLIIVLFLALKTNKKTESSWLSYLLQHKFRIIHNLTELKIETYYVSKVIESRVNEKKKLEAIDNQQTGNS